MCENYIDFAKYSSLKIGGVTPVVVLEKSDKESFVAMRKYRYIGHAYNLLVSPNALNLAMLSREFDYILESEEWVEVGAMTPSGKIFAFFRKHNLRGLEFLQALPGSAGGLLMMNAGMKQYEMKDCVLSACVNGIWTQDLGLAYRHSAICGLISAVRFRKKPGFREEVLQACKIMRKTHPKLPSCGSCFKNPKGDYAGRLLELAGLKGFMKNGVGFSEQHANFLVHRGGASFEDVLWVIEYAQKKVQDRFGILLEPEVRILD
ncbi:UDP-N-acetylmuramate dehydrogenase [Helicobacter sp.]|uniref:UDP-N-acetylmuramate dehydrogenase n=1 Tax=Helicobacter sp. TaxID=218 RepID=UPI0025C135CE|nr:UDP-N-acetylmuramate dehydrogenase [Helicobacter sp.]MBR2494139.1 UDP-N-acetylmuramate dehydrogenase [Helicobacter sp.]